MDFRQDSLEIAIMSLRNLKPGDRYIYFVGFLDKERFDRENDYAIKVGDVAYSLMTEGKILLTQRRTTPPSLQNKKIDWDRGIGGGFEYIATGANPPKYKPNITWAQLAKGLKP